MEAGGLVTRARDANDERRVLVALTDKGRALREQALHDRGAPIHLVQTTLGHASVFTTGRYLHAKPSDSSSFYLPD